MLKKSLIEATHFFAKNILDSDVSLFESCPVDRYYAASITINGQLNHTVTVYINRKSLCKMAYLFLLEDNPTEEILSDLIKEITNLIVGKAKVLASGNGLSFDISTPSFLSDTELVSDNDLEINFMFEDEIFSIAAKANS